MKYFIDRSIIANKLFPGINNWTSFSDILTSIFATDSTVLPTATTTVSGIVELATTEETSLGSDDTKAVTPAGLSKYIVDIPSASWTNGGTHSTYTLPRRTHLKGYNPVVTLLRKNGASYEDTLTYTWSFVASSGDITVKILTASVTDARLIIN